ncbi:hypothetical protein [Clostridium sp. SM-530-WT-3G]|uniref:hypothetical protein n=1 Tax=Clostridium sp. SM-530-WT-3G TaxID=2725303 RepID=UPI00145EF24F|nr:hypothetical protein [Clostridium sp. SM-530-WT-3G]NME83483.1 hypothetical protein [Clostridium sp. SM-530-WT-3G]
MNKIFIRLACIIIALLSFIQVEINHKFSKQREEINNIEEMHKDSSIKYKTLSKLNDEVSRLKMCSLIGASNDTEKWKVEVMVNGDSENILNQLTKLQKYEITSYHIVKNDEEKFIVLEMYGTE